MKCCSRFLFFFKGEGDANVLSALAEAQLNKHYCCVNLHCPVVDVQ